MKILPAAALPYAKGWAALIGSLGSTTLPTVWDGCPAWVPIVGAVATTVAVYLTPNAESVRPDVPAAD